MMNMDIEQLTHAQLAALAAATPRQLAQLEALAEMTAVKDAQHQREFPTEAPTVQEGAYEAYERWGRGAFAPAEEPAVKVPGVQGESALWKLTPIARQQLRVNTFGPGDAGVVNAANAAGMTPAQWVAQESAVSGNGTSYGSTLLQAIHVVSQAQGEPGEQEQEQEEQEQEGVATPSPFTSQAALDQRIAAVQAELRELEANR